MAVPAALGPVSSAVVVVEEDGIVGEVALGAKPGGPSSCFAPGPGFFGSAEPELEAGVSRHSVGTCGGHFFGGPTPLLLALEIAPDGSADLPRTGSSPAPLAARRCSLPGWLADPEHLLRLPSYH